ncbi:hypothetical protein MNBD_NITROSPINAE02-1757 [hydrothermal vent metagenome]|uniref:Uncharacterized protein n=1 Tax=hydrothermal vent metagenome TaxID=652676 RepID=A0A3B1CIC7_9ZZZZ
MAKLIFFQDVPFEAFGVEFIAGYLKSKGHTVDLIILNQEPKGFDPIDFLKKEKPDVVGFSITTIDFNWSRKLALEIKQEKELRDMVIIFGGAHPTMWPEMIEKDGIDIICVGEGEGAICEVMDNINNGVRDFAHIENLHVKIDGKIIKNKLRDLIQDHDSMPFPDREIYYNRYSLLKNMSTKKFFSGRGCPYKCTYCNNHHYQQLFKGLGKYVTYRSPQKVIDEIKEVRDRWGFKNVYLAAETVTTNRRWLTEFLVLYKEQINVPFSCLSRVNELNEDIIRKMADAGCYFTSFGLESGNERIRNELLNRKMSNEKILEVSGLLHKYKIKFLVHQIFALPTETPAEAFETIDMNIRMKADSTWSSIFQPVLGTEMYKFCKDNKLLAAENAVDNIDSMYGDSTLNQPYTRELSNLQKLVYLCIKFPALVPVVRLLIRLPHNPLFELVSKWNQLMSFRLRYRLGYIEMVKIYLGSNKRFG